MLEARPLTAAAIADLAELFAGDRDADGCWCMWFIIGVKAYHQGRSGANATRFRELVATSAAPTGLIAYLDGAPAGWAAAGPRSRYARAVRTPTMRATGRAEDDAVWLVPCLFVRATLRRRGIARHLLRHAVALARDAGARAIEGFPQAGAKLMSADRQVGTETLFASCGFQVIDRPSSRRVLMRRDLAGR